MYVQLAKLVSQLSPLSRWPALAVNSALPSTDPVRAGQALFTVQCLTCHKLNGAGAAEVGPDLNLPQNPTEYLTPQGLHDLIRNPKAVRTWPAQTMPALSDYLSDHEIELIIAYLSTWPAGSRHSSCARGVNFFPSHQRTIHSALSEAFGTTSSTWSFPL